MPPKNLCPWYSMVSISAFQFFVSFSCVFIKFDTKFDCATLLDISFLHFRNPSLLHILTQLAAKSDMLMILSWKLHWSSSKKVCLGWCLSCGYSVASCRATHSVSLLSWRTTYYIIDLEMCYWLCTTKLILGIWHSEDRSSWYIPITKPKRSTDFSNLFLEYDSTWFGQFLFH